MNQNVKKCPFGKKCLECEWYVEMIYENAVTQEKKPEYHCAVSWIPLLMVEGTKVGIQQVRATEGLRNENANGQKLIGIAAKAMIGVMEIAAGRKLPPAQEKQDVAQSKDDTTSDALNRR